MWRKLLGDGWGIVRKWLGGAAFLLLILAAPLPFSANLAAQQTVTVGGYVFPPYVEMAPDGQVSGLTLDLIAAWNEQQDDLRFEFFLTSPARRFSDFIKGNYDLILFESPGWGWTARELPIVSSEVFLTDSDVFIALAQEDRDQTYFDSFSNKSIVAMLGYHYAFADFETNPERLAQNFDIVLVNGNLAGIHLVLQERVDLAIITRSYLDCFLASEPQERDKLLIAETPDQIYRYRALLRPETPIEIKQVEALIEHNLTPELLEQQCLRIAAWQ